MSGKKKKGKAQKQIALKRISNIMMILKKYNKSIKNNRLFKILMQNSSHQRQKLMKLRQYLKILRKIGLKMMLSFLQKYLLRLSHITSSWSPLQFSSFSNFHRLWHNPTKPFHVYSELLSFFLSLTANTPWMSSIEVS